MNIFVLDKDPAKAAEYLCDKHVVKMVLESAQILCSVSHLRGIEAPYRLTHKKHPVVIWSNSALGNYSWLITHAFAICNEYQVRYGKIHKSKRVIEWCKEYGGKPRVDVLTKFAQCMPNEYKGPDAVEAYRKYYREEKSHIVSWKDGRIPYWWRI